MSEKKSSIPTGLSPNQTARAVFANMVNGNMATYVEGPPGIGKSAIGSIIKDMLGNHFNEEPVHVMFDAPTHDSVDCSGIPVIIEGYTTFATPEMFKTFGTRPVLFQIEEGDKCRDMAMFSAIAGILLEARIGNKYLGDRFFRYMTGNRLMDRTGAVKIPPHVINRLCRLTMGVSFKDFEQWSQRNGINPILLAWLKKFTEFLYKYDPEKNHHCTPRSLAFVSNVLNNPTGDPVLDQARIEGFIGEGPATELLSYTTYLSRMPDPDDAYAHPDTCRVPDDSEPDVQYAMQQSMIWRANAKNIGALRKYMKRMPKDLEVATLLALFEKDVKFRNHTEVAAWSAENSKLVLNTMMNK